MFGRTKAPPTEVKTVGDYTQKYIDGDRSVFYGSYDGSWRFYLNSLSKTEVNGWAVSGYAEDRNAPDRYYFVRLWTSGESFRAICSHNNRVNTENGCEHSKQLFRAYKKNEDAIYTAYVRTMKHEKRVTA